MGEVYFRAGSARGLRPNHPHSCTLHDIGRYELDEDGGAANVLVIELADGETLAARLSRGTLPLDRALTYGIEIASALDRAHKAGVVPAPVSSRQPIAPRALDEVVAACLAKDPDERWPNAAAVGRLLQRIVAIATFPFTTLDGHCTCSCNCHCHRNCELQLATLHCSTVNFHRASRSTSCTSQVSHAARDTTRYSPRIR
jgi:hypothetical protein